MKIVADRDIFQVAEYFSGYGELALMPGREITHEHVRHADALLVRTITAVNEALVKDTDLRFIGSAASGTDHVDQDCLAVNKMTFAHAPGCNADAVVDYVFAALAWLARQGMSQWRDKRIGIIGAGNVGSRLAHKMLALGLPVSIHDPLLPASHPLASCFVSLDQALSCDIISLHVPLTVGGDFPTRHLLQRQRLSTLAEGAILINASRGEVIDNTALLELLAERADLHVVLDVWEGEPGINPALASQVAIATPHIAGYSRNGKRNATLAVHQAFCECFGLDCPELQRKSPAGTLELSRDDNHEDLVDSALLQAYPVSKDFLDTQVADLAGHFDRRRNNYAFRPEYRDYVFNAGALIENLVRDLESLGFRRQ